MFNGHTDDKPAIIPDASTMEQAAIQAADRDIKAGVQFGTGYLWRLLIAGAYTSTSAASQTVKIDPPVEYLVFRFQSASTVPVTITFDNGDSLYYSIPANLAPIEVNYPGQNIHGFTLTFTGISASVYVDVAAVTGMNVAAVGLLL